MPPYPATDHRITPPSKRAAADQTLTKPGRCRSHQASSAANRAKPRNGSAKPAATDAMARIWNRSGVRETGATSQIATPNTKRMIEAVHKPVFDCQRDTKDPNRFGAARPKTPSAAARIDTAMTIKSDI